jgi:ribonuclease P protein component
LENKVLPHQAPETFRAFERLTGRQDILRVRRSGRKRVGRLLVFWCRKRDEAPPERASRFGVVVSRKNGNAVRRNRFKRRMRDIFRRHKGLVPRGWDILVSARMDRDFSKETFPPPHDRLLQEFLELARPLSARSDGASRRP